MANLLQEGETFLNGRLEECCSEQVVYHPRGGAAVKVPATLGRTFFKVEDVNGIVTRLRSVDFIVPAAALGAVPQKGDVVERGGTVFEVFAPSNEPCWRYSGTNCEMYRIHTHSLGANDYISLEGG